MAERRFALLVAASPNRMPSVGADGRKDILAPRTVEEAAWNWLTQGARTGLLHKQGPSGVRVVESSIYRGPPWEIDTASGKVTVRKGDWLIGIIAENETVWQALKNRTLNAASVQGSMARRPPRPKTLKRQRTE